MKIPKQKIKRFQKKIFLYYRKNKRDLPWRQTTDPYHILVSEIMLQQTQVQRVITFYNTWITRWPTIHDLAKASRTEVLNAWMGLGYNKRALNLHNTARIISTHYNGDVLQALQSSTELPGIGRYTKNAVVIFSTNADITTVDTNIRRILIHEFHLPTTTSAQELQQIADHCIPQGRSRDWHNALMDYGSEILTSKTTKIRPVTTQSTFEGSDRQIRAQLLRLFLDKPYSEQELQTTLQIPSERLTKILEKMTNERIVVKHNDLYRILDD